MRKFNEYTPDDAPPGWREYGDLLRAQPVPGMSPQRSATMLSAVHDAIPSYTRRQRVIRYVSAPMLSIATAALAFFLGVLPALDDGPALPADSIGARPAANSAPRPVHHQVRRRPEYIAIPQADMVPLPDTITMPQLRPAPDPVVTSQPGPGPGPGPAGARSHTANGR